MDPIRLRPGLPGGRWACLRRLRGRDEAAVEGTSGLAAAALLERLLVEVPGTTVSAARVWELTACDRDRLLAEVFRRHFGDRVEGVLVCGSCGERYEMAFSLTELVESVSEPASSDGNGDGPRGAVSGPEDDGSYRLADGRLFRLPTLKELRQAADLEPETVRGWLLERCLLDGDAGDDPDGLEAAMAAVGPTLDLDLEAPCSECGTVRKVRFDAPAYLLATLEREKRWLRREVHDLATVYGWSHGEILDLPRDDRRAYVRLIEADRAAGREAFG